MQWTRWNATTGEVIETGDFPRPPKAAEGEKIYAGQELPGDEWTFDIETEEPIARTSPRPKTDAELNGLINRERTRRIERGKTIEGIRVTGSDKDIMNLTNLAMGAQLRLAMGDQTTTIFRDGDNVDHELTPAQVLGLWQEASQQVSAIYQASWAIKAMNPIPQNVASDDLWP